MKLPGPIGLVPVPVRDHEIGHLAVDEELERLVAHLLARDGVDAHGGEPIPRYAPGRHGGRKDRAPGHCPRSSDGSCPALIAWLENLFDRSREAGQDHRQARDRRHQADRQRAGAGCPRPARGGGQGRPGTRADRQGLARRRGQGLPGPGRPPRRRRAQADNLIRQQSDEAKNLAAIGAPTPREKKAETTKEAEIQTVSDLKAGFVGPLVEELAKAGRKGWRASSRPSSRGGSGHDRREIHLLRPTARDQVVGRAPSPGPGSP